MAEFIANVMFACPGLLPYRHNRYLSLTMFVALCDQAHASAPGSFYEMRCDTWLM
jgi:hypothetical protein